MAEAIDEVIESDELVAPSRRRGRGLLLALAAILALGLLGAWLLRERIVDKVVAGQLAELGLPATYKVEQAGPRRQILTNLVFGDPARPDLTIERVEVDIVPTLGLPTIGKIMLVRPRLYGVVKDGKISFGSLDTVIYAKSDAPLRLPDMDLQLIDGRARIETPFGRAGIKAEGKGNLRGGFAGALAAVAPRLESRGCQASGASLFGTIAVANELPRFKGPIRLSNLDCPEQNLRLQGGAAELDIAANAALDTLSGKVSLRTADLTLQDSRAASGKGTGEFALNREVLTASYSLAVRTAVLPGINAGELSSQGMVRARRHYAVIENEGTVEGSGLAPGARIDAALARIERAGQATLVAPFAAQLRTALRQEASGSRIEASYTLRSANGATTVIVPRAVLTGKRGANLASLSRAQISIDGGYPRIAGNISTGGAGFPQLEGRFERQGNGAIHAQLSMAEYRARDSRLALPRLTLIQTRSGELGFSGQAVLSGALPGGRIDRLALPLNGNWSSRHGLSAWRGCTQVQFDRLRLVNLTLDARAITLCPGRVGAIVRYKTRGLYLAAGTPGLALTGRLGSTALRVRTGALGFAWPGALHANRIDVMLSGEGSPTTLKFETITGQLGRTVSGRFSGAEVKLNTVPLDVLDASAAWSFAEGTLRVSDGNLRVLDRQTDARFRPLIARNATLGLKGSDFSAEALLREPKSDREVVLTRIVHDMADGIGHATLTVPGLIFDKRMQPDTLTALALGVVANAKGSVNGNGRIDWSPARVTSTGRFHTEKLDFAAAFGPVEGVSGTVEFTDLLGLVTAPDQRLKIAAINPGIEVDNGVLSFELQGENVLMVNGARWPFLDGTLELQPTRMVLGASEVRRYTLVVDGINAAKFVDRMELGNLSASGSFDGTLPLVFDEEGGHIEGGLLTSRAPGGNLSYVGELSYKDLGTMGNFAFQALRSLDYRKMQIALDGNLEGDIVTRVRIDGVRQGDGAKRNFITQRFAGLPIQFNINVRAPFQRLVTTFKSIYDPAYVRDPRELGIVDGNGQPVRQQGKPPPGNLLPNKQDIQAPASRNMR